MNMQEDLDLFKLQQRLVLEAIGIVLLTKNERSRLLQNSTKIIEFLNASSGADFIFQYDIDVIKYQFSYLDFVILIISSCLQDKFVKNVFSIDIILDLIDSYDKFDFIFKNVNVVKQLAKMLKSRFLTAAEKEQLKKICAHILKKFPEIYKMNGFYVNSRKMKNNSKVRIPLFKKEDIDKYF